MSVIFALILPIVSVLCGSGGAVLSSFYRPEYAAAGPALALLVLGIFCLGMTLVFCMIISAAGRERFTSWLALCLLAFYAGLSFFLTRRFSITGTALANLLCTAAAMLASGIYAGRLFGRFLTGRHALLIALCAALCLCAFGLFALLPRLSLPALLAIYLALYLAALALMRLLKLVDFKKALSMVKKEKKTDE